MKLLKNEAEYRDLMEKEYLHLYDQYPSLLDPDEQERVFREQMPKEFPCLVNLYTGYKLFESPDISFIYASQVAQWSKLFTIGS